MITCWALFTTLTLRWGRAIDEGVGRSILTAAVKEDGNGRRKSTMGYDQRETAVAKARTNTIFLIVMVAVALVAVAVAANIWGLPAPVAKFFHLS